MFPQRVSSFVSRVKGVEGNARMFGGRQRCGNAWRKRVRTFRVDITYSLILPEAGLMLGATVTVVSWAVGNLVYLDLRRKGIHGFTRFIAFWMGNPWTWLSFFLVQEGTQQVCEAPPDDDALLLQEVRKDRLLRERAERRAPIAESDREATTPEP